MQRVRIYNRCQACVKPASTKQPDPPPLYDCKIFDGAAFVHALSSTTVSTFDSYAENVFIPFNLNHLQSSKGVDTVWKTYKANSIKDSTREKRGKGQRRKVTGDTKDSSKMESISSGQYQQKRTL